MNQSVWLRSKGFLHMMEPPPKIRMGPQRVALAPSNPVLAPWKPYMLNCPQVSHTCSNFFPRHHSLDAHTTNFYPAAIFRFPMFSITVFGSFLLTFSIDFFIPGWMAKSLPGQSEWCFYHIMKEDRNSIAVAVRDLASAPQ